MSNNKTHLSQIIFGIAIGEDKRAVAHMLYNKTTN